MSPAELEQRDRRRAEAFWKVMRVKLRQDHNKRVNDCINAARERRIKQEAA